ncbi:MAG: DEAD/DEAH box helicase [Gemmatimonadaceae bacterium]
MEHEQDSAATPGVTRGQNQLHVMPEDWQAAAVAIEPLLDRLDADATGGGPRLLVITNDAEAAVGVAGRIAPAAATRGLRVLAATDVRRAARVHRSAPAHIVVGSPVTLGQLLHAAALKLDGVHAVVLAWVEDLNHSATTSLETIMAELPKDAPRMVLAGAMTPAVDQLVERYARRARKMQPTSGEPVSPVSLSYVAVGESARLAAVRRILDAFDPESAAIVARNPESRAAVDALLRSLGYGGDASTVCAADMPATDAQLIVLYDLPSTAEELQKLVAGRSTARTIALVAARQIAALRRLAGGVVTPLALPEAAARARTREESVRDELRDVLSTGQYSRELLALEPLLADFDGTEVAAAALRLLEAERAKPQSPSAAAATTPMTRLYLNVGEMDNVRPGDLVGAITNEAGISKSELGRVEVRERHSTVEVATSVANAVVSKMNGVSIRGRRALVKVDEERSGRDRGPRRDGSGRDSAPRDRGSRPPRPSGPPRDRGSRPPRDRVRPRREDS